MINKIILFLFIKQLFIKFILSHSWISCTDYQLPSDYPTDIYNYTNNRLLSISYDITKCNGFPRNYDLQYQSDLNRGFGFDTGYNYKGTECKYQNTFNTLKNAKYKSGSTVCLTYPSKNHVASECTNKYILDNGVKIFRNNKPLDNTINKEIKHLNGIHQKDTIDYKGFQNCPGFCNNPDKTVCYMCFKLEDNIESGVYSFKWVWEFNAGEFYSSCWDAEIENISNKILIEPECNNRKLQSNNYRYVKDNICHSTAPIINPTSTINPPTPTTNPTPVVNPTQPPSTNNKKCKYNNSNNSNNSNAPILNTESPTNIETNLPTNIIETNSPTNIIEINSPTNIIETNLSTNVDMLLANIWEQCGGNNINKKCNNGECVKFSPYYSQCLPNELDYKALCGQDDNKEIKWFYNKCKSGTKCIKYNNSMDYRCQ